jgi:hypothetical protein
MVEGYASGLFEVNNFLFTSEDCLIGRRST